MASSKKTDLVARETILGVLKSKDIENKGVIHSSDFRSAINELGYPLGSRIIESILIHCKLDSDGNIDFKQLERELVRERRVYNSEPKSKINADTTSSSAPSKPWRADLTHQQKVAAEIQMKTVHEHRVFVNDIYKKLSYHEIDKETALSMLKELEIYPTKEFIRVLNIMSRGELLFTDFINALTKYDTTNIEETRTAGSVTNRATIIEKDDQRDPIFVQRKRYSAQSAKSNFSITQNDNDEKNKTIRKMRDKDAFHFKAASMRDMIFGDTDENIPLLTQSQQHLLTGLEGVEIELSFNSEQRLQREQVLAAIRKLDAGQLSLDDFQDMLFSMGFELPDTIRSELRRSIIAGRVDCRKLVSQLDAMVFKVYAVEDQLHPDEIESFKKRFVQSVQRSSANGTGGFIDLIQMFRRLDKDQDEKLTYQEFKRGYSEFLSTSSLPRNPSDGNQPLNGEELRRLFNAMDKNGDGVLSYSEFVPIIRGDLSPFRNSIVTKAFKTLDRHGENSVELIQIMDYFHGDDHPEVTSGRKSSREVTSDFVNWFLHKKDFNGHITLSEFIEYYANLSYLIPDDPAFKQFIQLTWQVPDIDQAPPPPLYKQRQGPPVPPPMAKQSHGDLIKWQQLPSKLENETTGAPNRRRLVGGYEQKNLHTDILKWTNQKGLGHKELHDAATQDLKLLGGIQISKGMKNISSKSLFEWKMDTKPPPEANLPMEYWQGNVEENHLPYQNEMESAGKPSFSHSNRHLDRFGGSQPVRISGSLNEFLHGEKPYGVDVDPSSNAIGTHKQRRHVLEYTERLRNESQSTAFDSPNATKKVVSKSLSDTLKEKKHGEKSLLKVLSP